MTIKHMETLRGALRTSFHKMATASVVILGMGVSAQAEPIELIYNIFIPPQAGIVKNGLAPWAKAVEEASNGTLKLTIPTSSLAPPPLLWDAVEDGIADIALVVNAHRSKKVALPLIASLPLADGNAEQVSRAWWQTYETHFAAANEYKNFIPLAGFTTNGGHLMARDTLVQSIADFDGLKIRVEGANQVAIFKALGASPVGAPGLDSFELLTGGVVDAGVSPFGSAVVQGMVGVTNKVTMLPGGFSRSGFTIIMNKDKFESLPEAAQKALLSTSGVELSAKLGRAVDAEEVAGLETFKKDGATIVEASDEFVAEITKRVKFLEDEWLEIAAKRGLDGPKVLAYYRAQIAAGK